METNDKIVVIIPARGGSKRLFRKNIHPVLGKPMIHYAIEAAMDSKYVSEIIVSTDSHEIRNEAKKFDKVVVHDRCHSISDDKTFKQDVIVNVLKEVYEESSEKPDIVLSVQANSPEISAPIIDKIIEIKKANQKKEIFTVDSSLMQNGAVRAMDYDYCFLKTLSMYCGVYVCDLLDVHTIQDIEIVEKRMSLNVK